MSNQCTADIIARLQKEILPLQGLRTALPSETKNIGWGKIDQSFPNGCFPVAAVHEFIYDQPQNAAATAGFMAAILAALSGDQGACVWIGSRRTLFPPALTSFGLAPDRVIFIDLQQQKDILWTLEEALQCKCLSAVIGEVDELSFTASRRLQLAVEQSHVTGFIFRRHSRNLHTNACVSRWKITGLPSEGEDGMPGMGFARWNVELLKIRNGRPGSWQLEWSPEGFRHIEPSINYIPLHAVGLPGQHKEAG